ncbi:MarR family transcriptional regulator [Actinoplanes sp. NPDC026619]|uniref:MarR family winged helix-turn-helix transcriptional regulator n=1 Tax=Actinoplanes sp. NPDC026619 TaxID=3155798 RepID=UPI0033ED21BE
MELPDRLVWLIRGFGRALVQATRRAGHSPPLPESQVMALRVLSHSGGRTPAQLADDLQLARPTVSNLVRDLTADALVERRPSAADGRSVLLVPTERAEGVLNAFRRGRSDVMARAVAGLPAEDQERIAAALPSLSLLLDRIRAQG